jgi:hypothetical protein
MPSPADKRFKVPYLGVSGQFEPAQQARQVAEKRRERAELALRSAEYGRYVEDPKRKIGPRSSLAPTCGFGLDFSTLSAISSLPRPPRSAIIAPSHFSHGLKQGYSDIRLGRPPGAFN